MAKKFYAVKQGRVPGVYGTWEECREQVHGYSGAVYKSFPTAEEAMGYVTGQKREEGRQALQRRNAVVRDDAVNPDGQKMLEDTAEGMEVSSVNTGDFITTGQLAAYVDGSYYSETGEFSYGVVILQNGTEYCFNEKLSDPELASMHNVAGEIKGAEAAMRYAAEHGCRQITIYHDYEGIARWCTGDWKANKPGTRAYKAYYDRISKQVEIRFQKVKGHSGDKYNDMADRLAKQALGI